MGIYAKKAQQGRCALDDSNWCNVDAPQRTPNVRHAKQRCDDNGVCVLLQPSVSANEDDVGRDKAWERNVEGANGLHKGLLVLLCVYQWFTCLETRVGSKAIRAIRLPGRNRSLIAREERVGRGSPRRRPRGTKPSAPKRKQGTRR